MEEENRGWIQDFCMEAGVRILGGGAPPPPTTNFGAQVFLADVILLCDVCKISPPEKNPGSAFGVVEANIILST